MDGSLQQARGSVGDARQSMSAMMNDGSEIFPERRAALQEKLNKMGDAVQRMIETGEQTGLSQGDIRNVLGGSLARAAEDSGDSEFDTSDIDFADSEQAFDDNAGDVMKGFEPISGLSETQESDGSRLAPVVISGAGDGTPRNNSFSNEVIIEGRLALGGNESKSNDLFSGMPDSDEVSSELTTQTRQASVGQGESILNTAGSTITSLELPDFDGSDPSNSALGAARALLTQSNAALANAVSSLASSKNGEQISRTSDKVTKAKKKRRRGKKIVRKKQRKRTLAKQSNRPESQAKIRVYSRKPRHLASTANLLDPFTYDSIVEVGNNQYVVPLFWKWSLPLLLLAILLVLARKKLAAAPMATSAPSPVKPSPAIGASLGSQPQAPSLSKNPEGSKTSQASGMSRSFEPNQKYVLFDLDHNRWVLVKTDFSGQPSQPLGEIQTGTVLPGEMIGADNELRYQLSEKNVWTPTNASVEYIIRFFPPKS